MNGQYPRFKNSYFYEELTEHFLLTTAEFRSSSRGVPFHSLEGAPDAQAPSLE